MDVQFDEETEKLKSVFDLLDSEKTGFISVERFIEVAAEHFCNSDWDSTAHEVRTVNVRQMDENSIQL
jgi:Ca2+-binding EF-hand superfamily protein